MAGPRLVVIGGLPGTGKTTVGDQLAVHLGCPVFNKDRVEASLRRDGVTAEQDSWTVAENLLTTLAAEQLRRGQSAILDTVARVAESRAAWRATAEEADAAFRLIECVCNDPAVHRARIEGRIRGIPGWAELTWDDVQAVRARWKPWGDERLVLDALEPASANVAEALRYLE